MFVVWRFCVGLLNDLLVLRRVFVLVWVWFDFVFCLLVFMFVGFECFAFGWV